jgi:hypothetical protein
MVANGRSGGDEIMHNFRNGARVHAGAAFITMGCLQACGADPSSLPEERSGQPSEQLAPSIAVTVPTQTGDVEKASGFFDEDPTTYYNNGYVYTKDYLCVLSKIGGEIEDFGGQELHIDVTSRGDTWWDLSYETNARTRLICTPWSNFRLPTNGQVRLSSEFSLSLTTYSSDTEDANMWGGDAATALSGIDASAMNGYGEYALIKQATSATADSVLEIRSKAGIAGVISAYIEGWGQSIFVGDPAAHKLVKLIGWVNGDLVSGNVNTTGTFEYNVSTTSGFQNYWMATTDQAICYFTKISGEFDGGGEYSRIYQNGTQWYLTSVAGGGEVKASARCMAYRQ